MLIWRRIHNGLRVPCLLLLALGCSDQEDASAPVTARESIAAPASTEAPNAEQTESDSRREELWPYFERLNSRRTRDAAFAGLGARLTADDATLLVEAFDATGSSSAQWRILALMAYAGASDAAARVQEALRNSSSHHVRRNAAYTLGALGDRSALGLLKTTALEDAEFSVRRASVKAIYDLLGEEADDRLWEIWADTNDGGLRAAIDWLLDDEFKGTVEPDGNPGRVIDASLDGTHYKLYLPLRARRGTPLLISVHGTDGVPEPYLNMWLPDAEKHTFAVLAPHFDNPTFPFYDLLEIGLGSTKADKRLLAIVDEVARYHPIRTDKFYLFGHSKGGQFVTRFVLAHPDRIIAAAASGSGHYVRYDPNGLFPGGTKPNPLAPDVAPLDFGDLVRTPLAVVLGTRELERRKAQANAFMDDVQRYADEHDVRSQVELIWVPDGPHRGVSNQPAASEFFFGKR